MEVELRTDGHHCHSVGYFNYQHFTNNTERGTIWLHGVLCNFCNGHLLDAEDYCDVLEHEYVELLCAKIAWFDDVIPNGWNGAGFNKAIYNVIPDKTAFHMHGRDNISSVKYMGYVYHTT